MARDIRIHDTLTGEDRPLEPRGVGGWNSHRSATYPLEGVAALVT